MTAPSPSASSVSAYIVPQDRALDIWPAVERFIVAAADRSDERADLWRDRLGRGDMQLWVGWNGADYEAAVLTQLVPRKTGTACQIVACGGHDRGRWFWLLGEIERWAVAEGCSEIRVVNGRKGWMRAMPDYAVTGVTLRKEIA